MDIKQDIYNIITDKIIEEFINNSLLDPNDKIGLEESRKFDNMDLLWSRAFQQRRIQYIKEHRVGNYYNVGDKVKYYNELTKYSRLSRNIAPEMDDKEGVIAHVNSDEGIYNIEYYVNDMRTIVSVLFEELHNYNKVETPFVDNGIQTEIF